MMTLLRKFYLFVFSGNLLVFSYCSFKKTINKTVTITNINIPIITADKAPVLPSSKVDAKARGISATIPENIIKDIPLPIPLNVICSPTT